MQRKTTTVTVRSEVIGDKVHLSMQDDDGVWHTDVATIEPAKPMPAIWATKHSNGPRETTSITVDRKRNIG